MDPHPPLLTVRSASTALWPVLSLLLGACLVNPATHAAPYGGLAVRLPTASNITVPDSPPPAGLVVTDLDPEGPAIRVGIQTGDRLLLWDDQRLFHPTQLEGLIRTSTNGRSHRLTLDRDDLSRQVELALADRPAPSDSPQLPVAVVPYANWSESADFVDDLPELAAALLTPTNLVGTATELVTEGWFHQAALVLLLQTEDASLETTGETTSSSPPLSPLDAAPGPGAALFYEDWGSVEIIDQTGRSYVIVRNLQESVLFESTIDSEVDLSLLRPLRPHIRERVEELLLFDDSQPPVPQLTLRALLLPSRFL